MQRALVLLIPRGWRNTAKATPNSDRGEDLVPARPIAPRARHSFAGALATLAFLAAGTERIRLGTNVLAGAWYPPALLARSLASVDQLSRGRLTIGLGSSPSEIESAAAGIDDAGSDQRVDELLGALEVAWRSGQGPGPLPRYHPFALPK